MSISIGKFKFFGKNSPFESVFYFVIGTRCDTINYKSENIMGLMNYIYKFFGFESDDVKVVTKKKNPQKATYNLKIKKELPDEIDGVKVFYPEDYADCKDRAELLKKGNPFFLDFRGCSSGDKSKALSFLSGVVEALGASMEEVEKNLYIFLPKNMKIERE